MSDTARKPAYIERIENLEQDVPDLDFSLRTLIAEKVSSVNGLTPDSNGNVDVGGMPLGTLFPYTGKDVPAGTLRADGTTYTDMHTVFPEFYEWVVNSGLTVPLGSYALVEGSCGYYGLDESTGTVRMPTLAAGVFGTAAARQYGQAVQAGLPNITGAIVGHSSRSAAFQDGHGVFSTVGLQSVSMYTGSYGPEANFYGAIDFNASRSSPIYGRSDTVTPSHVKYPWVIVAYNAAVPPSVAEAAGFVNLLDGKIDKVNPKDSNGNAILTSAGGTITAPIYADNTAIVGRYENGRLGFAASGGKAAVLNLFGRYLAGDYAGAVELIAENDGNRATIALFPNGNFVVNGKNIVHAVNGATADASGNVTISSVPTAAKTDAVPNFAVAVANDRRCSGGSISGKNWILPWGGTWRYIQLYGVGTSNGAAYCGEAAGGSALPLAESTGGSNGNDYTYNYIAVRIY